MKWLALSITAVCALWAQGSLGGLTGRVADSTGASIPDVSVQLHNVENGQEVKGATTSDGSFLVTNLAPGRYRVTMSKTGFRTVVRESVVISTATLSNADFILDVGSVSDSVTVS